MKLNRWPRPHACFSLLAINAPIPSLPTINAPAPSLLLYRIVEEGSYRILVSLYKTMLEQDRLVTIWNSVGGGSTCYYLELCWVRLSYYCVDLLTCHTCLLYMYPNILWCTLSKVLKIKQVCQVENNVYLLTCILSQVGISSLENAKK